MNNNKKNISVLFINANDYTVLSGADLYTHKLMDLISHNYNAKITEYSYDMCNYKHTLVNAPLGNVNILRPFTYRNWRDTHLWLKWALNNFWNTVWRSRRQILKIAHNFDIIIDGAMILYSDKKVMKQPNFILIQHQSYDFVQFKHYKWWTWLAVIMTYLYGTRDCFKRARNIMAFTSMDQQRIIKESIPGFKQNIFTTPHVRFKYDEIVQNWTKKLKVIEDQSFDYDFVYIGRVIKQQKRVHLLDQVINDLGTSTVCVGDGSYLNRLQKNKNIKCLGKIAASNVPDFYIKSRCSILLSDYEGMPGSVTEAIATGTPVITTVDIESVQYLQSKLGDAVQIISSRITGKKLSDEVQRRYKIITDDQDKYKRLCQSCIEFAKRELTVESFENKWLNVIDHLLKK